MTDRIADHLRQPHETCAESYMLRATCRTGIADLEMNLNYLPSTELCCERAEPSIAVAFVEDCRT